MLFYIPYPTPFVDKFEIRYPYPLDSAKLDMDSPKRFFLNGAISIYNPRFTNIYNPPIFTISHPMENEMIIKKLPSCF
jgi:hypothetical protein